MIKWLVVCGIAFAAGFYTHAQGCAATVDDAARMGKTAAKHGGRLVNGAKGVAEKYGKADDEK